MEHDGNGRKKTKKMKRKKMKTENTSFINYIKRNEPSSLESLAAMSIAITLWTQTDMKNVLEQQSSTTILKLTKRALEKIKNTTPIPKIIQNLLFSTIRSVGLQLTKCFNYYGDEYYNPDDLFSEGGPILWTNGVIDEVKSFKALMKKPDLDKCRLFELACKYCLEGIISDLWSEVKQSMGRSTSLYPCHLIFYWMSVLEENLTSFVDEAESEDTHDIYDFNQSIYRNMTSNAVYVANIYSLKYFWTKLTEEEKNANIKTWLHLAINYCNLTIAGDNKSYKYMQYYACTEILCFLLSHLKDQNEQKEFVLTQSETIFKSLFITWPFQEYFLPTLLVVSDYLHHDVYVKIITDILEDMEEDTTLEPLFLNIWKISSPLFKKTFYQLIKNSSWVILRILAGCSVKTVCLILENFSAEEKTRLLLNVADADYQSELCDMILESKLNLMDELFNTILSSNDVNTLKRSIIKYAESLFHNMKCTEDFLAVKKFLKWGFNSEDEIQSFKNEFDVEGMYSNLLVYSADDELADQFLNWYFKTEDELKKFRKKFITGSHRYRCVGFDWGLFEKCANDCFKFFPLEEIVIFKSDALNDVRSLLKDGRYEFATKLVNWCIDSVDEINRYKGKLLRSPEGISLLRVACVQLVAEDLIEWFSPISSDTLAELTSLIRDNDLSLGLDVAQESYFYYLLENSVANHKTPYHHYDADLKKVYEIL